MSVTAVIRAVMVLAISSAFASSDLSAHLVLTVKDRKGNQPTRQFRCQDTIYIHTKWSQLPPGNHQLECYWISPSGVLQERTVHAFHDLNRETWLWLKLEEAEGLFGRVFADKDQFTGRWKAELFLDGKPLKVLEFTVGC